MRSKTYIANRFPINVVFDHITYKEVANNFQYFNKSSEISIAKVIFVIFSMSAVHHRAT